MPRLSIPAFLALALCTVGALLLTTLNPSPAGAQQAGSCPQTIGSNTELTCTCSGAESGSVWGSDFYTDDSNICQAAVHAGAIPASGGTVTVRAEAGLERYSGSTRNGVTTSDYGRWGRTIMFDFVGSYQNVAACPAAYNANGTGWAGVCRCAGAGSGSVWGSGTYTADSSVCRAARHAGAIGAGGGVVRVTPWPGMSSYPGSTANGITTSTWGSYGASFRVSR